MSDSDSEDSEALSIDAHVDELTEAVDALEQWRDETNMRLDNIEARMGLFPQNIPNNNLPGAGGGKRKRKRKTRKRRKKKTKKRREKNRKKRTKRRR
jgi:RNA processing factor Prp31